MPAPQIAAACDGPPVTETETENAPCSPVGATARAADGGLMRCVWNNPDLPLNGVAGRP